MATRIGLEPTTPSVTGWCSNQLSYRAIPGADISAPIWSGRRGSNSLPPPWQGGALPDELRPHIRKNRSDLVLLKGGASDRNRTNDTGIFSPLLYRLSYRGRQAASCEAAATRIGLEPTTPSVTGWCSNQLSYRAIPGADISAPIWSGRRGSNSLPPPWQGGALPDELRPHIRKNRSDLVLLKGGASDRNRTNDTGIFSPLLYRLSYRGKLATWIGIEPTTSSVTG